MSMHPGRSACSTCEQRLLIADPPVQALGDAAVVHHLAECTDCRAFFESLRAVKPALDRYRVPEPPAELIERVVGKLLRIRPTSPAPERVPVRAVVLRVLPAGLVSLPLVIRINTLMGWALYELAAALLPRTFALYCIGLFAVWASLAVSVGYASLPFLDALVRRPPGRLWVADP